MECGGRRPRRIGNSDSHEESYPARRVLQKPVREVDESDELLYVDKLLSLCSMRNVRK